MIIKLFAVLILFNAVNCLEWQEMTKMLGRSMNKEDIRPELSQHMNNLAHENSLEGNIKMVSLAVGYLYTSMGRLLPENPSDTDQIDKHWEKSRLEMINALRGNPLMNMMTSVMEKTMDQMRKHTDEMKG